MRQRAESRGKSNHFNEVYHRTYVAIIEEFLMKRVIGLFAAMLIFLSRCGPNNMVAAANMAAEGDIILRVPLLRTGPLQCIRPHPRRPPMLPTTPG